MIRRQHKSLLEDFQTVGILKHPEMKFIDVATEAKDALEAIIFI